MTDHQNEQTTKTTVAEEDKVIQDILDISKRAYLLTTGSLITALVGCAQSTDETAETNQPEKPEEHTTYVASNSPDDTVSSQVCPMCDMPMPPPGAGTPPGAGSPGTPPATGTPGNPPATGNPPGSGTPGTGTPPATLAAQSFSVVGPTFASLRASDMMGGITQVLSDGNAIQVWGITSDINEGFNNNTARITPGPVIEALEGELTTVALRSMHPHTIHLHGLDVDQANDGVPSTSGYVSGMMGPFFRLPPGENLGSVFEYKFIAPHAGTYMYHCHVDTVLHMEMGMVGTVIVRPADGDRGRLWAAGPSFDREYIWHLHTFDSSWHNGIMTTGPNTLRYQPDYFLINGLDGADILADSATAIEAQADQRIAIRLTNPGYQPAVVSLGGIPFQVVASDGRPLKTAFNTPFTEFLVTPGERYDILFTMPASGVTSASVDYLNIQGTQVLGTAVSSITTL